MLHSSRFTHNLKGSPLMIDKLTALKNLAAQVLSSESSLSRVIQELSVKIAKNKPRLKEVSKDLTLMMKLLRSYSTGAYPEVPWKSLLSIVTACLYFLNPLDLVPDVFFLGMLDDIQVVMLVAGLVRNDLERFKKFLQEQDS